MALATCLRCGMVVSASRGKLRPHQILPGTECPGAGDPPGVLALPGERVAACHPERKHLARGLCRSCYDRTRQRDRRAAGGKPAANAQTPPGES